MKVAVIITIAMNVAYKLYNFIHDMESYMESYEEVPFDLVFGIFVSIITNVVLCMGVYIVGELMDEIVELKYMVASQKNNTIGRQYGSNVNIPSYNYQNQAYVNQNVQNTGYVESKPISNGWICSCGYSNANDAHCCMQCGKERE